MRSKITDKQRLAIFKSGYSLQNDNGQWWIARIESSDSRTLMQSAHFKSETFSHYFKTAKEAIDSFIINTRREKLYLK